AVAIIILLIACINFMNLATARSAKRAKEVGVRKVIGAKRVYLAIQFVGESVIIALISVFVSMLLVHFLLPVFNEITTGFHKAVNSTPFAECIGGDSREVWVYTRLNGTPATRILRYKPDTTYIGEYSHLNVPLFSNGFVAQAIYFDKFGNHWVGLKQGGLRIRKPDTSWVSMDAVSFNSIHRMNDQFIILQ
ncbi:MAG: ABC transporter permease, partial [Sphingobacteriales bacterium]